MVVEINLVTLLVVGLWLYLAGIATTIVVIAKLLGHEDGRSTDI